MLARRRTWWFGGKLRQSRCPLRNDLDLAVNASTGYGAPPRSGAGATDSAAGYIRMGS